MRKYYKYVDAKGGDILQSKRLKISDFCHTNDPFEILPRIEYPTDEDFWRSEFDRQAEYDPVFLPARLAKQHNPKSTNVKGINSRRGR